MVVDLKRGAKVKIFFSEWRFLKKIEEKVQRGLGSVVVLGG
jgi:hypothetical protein